MIELFSIVDKGFLALIHGDLIDVWVGPMEEESAEGLYSSINGLKSSQEISDYIAALIEWTPVYDPDEKLRLLALSLARYFEHHA